MKQLHLALIGYGTIASYVAEKLRSTTNITLDYVICEPGREEEAINALGQNVSAISKAEDLPDWIDLVVDCAGHPGLKAHGVTLLERGFKFFTISNGALGEAELASQLEAAAQKGNTQLRILSGAVGAIDALSAAATSGLSKVTYTGRKPCKGWKETPAEEILDLENLTEACEHFRGTAREAALRYPKNANVAATIALAGIGLDQTEVVLIADPDVTRNCHEIHAEGDFGILDFKIQAAPLATNPKSSALTAMNVLRAIQNEAAIFVI